MPYTPNNPYVPGDPYSYDLKWLVNNLNKLKETITYLEQAYTTPTVVDTAAEMTDKNKIYVYVGSEIGYSLNHWYYYDPDTNLWTDGGAYGAIDIDVSLDISSNNAVRNSAITAALAGKQDSLVLPLPITQGGTGKTTSADAMHALINPITSVSSLSAGDYIIKDTGSVARRVQVSGAYATDTQPGFVSTASQTFKGEKTFNDYVDINMSANPGLYFKTNNITLSNVHQNTTDKRMEFRQNSYDSLSGDPIPAYADVYSLPEASPDLAATSNYRIATTKTLSKARFSNTISAAGQTTTRVTFDVTRVGYIPLGIVGVTNSGGAGCSISDFYLAGTEVDLYIYNPDNTTRTITWSVDVLYV